MNVSRVLSPLSAAAALLALAAAFPLGCREAPLPAPRSPVAAPAPVVAPALPVVVASAQASAEPEAPLPPAVASRFAVATENATATRLAMDVLERGGNAVDAAVAAVLAVGVAQPVSSGLGGGGFALVWSAKTKAVTVLDFRETAPRGLRPNEYLKRPPPEKRRGVMVGVPGEVAGLTELHARFGKLAFADDVRGAADAAEKGFPLSAHLVRALKWSEAWVRKTPRYAFFAPRGALLGPREMVTNPALAATLRRLASEGRKAFYEGALAADVLATARAGGSRMTAAELQGYAPLERAPLRTAWEGYEVFTMPAPSAGGLLLLETLHMHDKAALAALGYGSAAYEHLLAETFRGAVADRVRAVGDPAFVRADLEALASPARMKARRAKISATSTTPAERFTLTESGTSHVVVADGEGNVVSITSTVNDMFGSKLVTAGGFVLNDELDDFTREATGRRFGVDPGPNAPRGGARPVSSMTPTIVVRHGAAVFAAGGSGGMRIPTGVTQVLLAHLVFGRSPALAVADPRIETPALGGLLVDPELGAAVVQELERAGEVVDTTQPNFSGVQAVALGTRDGVRVLEAGADPRKGGEALVE